MFEHSASDRMQVRSVGDLRQPGTCMLCGSGNKEWYLDLGVFFDWEGQMYLCQECIYQCAEAVGCLIPAEVQHLQESSENLASQLLEANEELRKANERLALYDSVFSDAGRAFAVASSTSSGSTDESPSEVVEGSAEGESVPEESIKIGRRNDPERVELRNAVPDGDRFRGGIEL